MAWRRCRSWPGPMAVSEEFGQAMVALAELYGAQLSEEKIRLYADLLADLSFEQIKDAMRRSAQQSRFFPTVAELRAQVVDTQDDKALTQWSGLCRAAEDVGGYQDLYVDDRATATALRAVFGSWGAFCEQCVDGPALAMKRQEFLAAYRQAKRAEPLVRRAIQLEPERLGGLLGGEHQSGCTGHLSALGVVVPLALPPGDEQKKLPE